MHNFSVVCLVEPFDTCDRNSTDQNSTPDKVKYDQFYWKIKHVV